jgi:hypothetical protein
MGEEVECLVHKLRVLFKRCVLARKIVDIANGKRQTSDTKVGRF